jgi:hypothetical protein
LGSPQIPLPVSLIAPNPRRFTSRSLPILNVFAGVLILQPSTAQNKPQSFERGFFTASAGYLSFIASEDLGFLGFCHVANHPTD